MIRPQTVFYFSLVGVGLGIILVATDETPTTLSERQKVAITQKFMTEVMQGELLYSLPEMRRPSVSFTTADPVNASETVCEWRLVSEGTPAWSVRVNEKLAASHYHRFMTETVPHEVAHLLGCQLRDPLWWDHGAQWATIVRDMGATPVIRHDYGKN